MKPHKSRFRESDSPTMLTFVMLYCISLLAAVAIAIGLHVAHNWK
jgi:hypothetical protein